MILESINLNQLFQLSIIAFDGAADDSAAVGSPVGIVLGAGVGPALGAGVGPTVGADVGDAVGSADGATVGVELGAGVGPVHVVLGSVVGLHQLHVVRDVGVGEDLITARELALLGLVRHVVPLHPHVPGPQLLLVPLVRLEVPLLTRLRHL